MQTCVDKQNPKLLISHENLYDLNLRWIEAANPVGEPTVKVEGVRKSGLLEDYSMKIG